MIDFANKSLIDEFGNIHHLTDELARGGQGVVYRTQDEDLAIKLSSRSDNSVDFKSRFRDIRTLPLPRGIHISMPLAILRDEPGYVMRLLNGLKPFNTFSLDGLQRSAMHDSDFPQWLTGLDKKSAQDLVYYAQTGSTRRRLYALYKCAAILARLHNAGIVYGDISLGNVFISEGIPGDCWLIDADNLRFELPRGGESVYTPKQGGLGAPEVVQRKDASRPRTDCWAFAVMAFQLLALCPPFRGEKVLNPDEACGWDAEISDGEIPADLDEQAEAGYLPFIDDEDDDSNALPNGGLPRMLILTPQLRLLFQETLGTGRLSPHRRISMMFWALELARAFDNSVICPFCKMSSFFSSEMKQCPYCKEILPEIAIAKTDCWQMILNAEGQTEFEALLPNRLFHPFSLTDGDIIEYNAIVNLKTHHVIPDRGSKPFPQILKFEFLRREDEK